MSRVVTVVRVVLHVLHCGSSRWAYLYCDSSMCTSFV